MLSRYFKTKIKSKNFDDNLRNLIKENKDKKVLIYGAGQGFKELDKKYLFSKNLNIKAVADKKFENKHNKFFNGIRAIAPEQITKEDYDVILISNENAKPILKYLIDDLKINNKNIQAIFKEEIKDERTNFNYLQKINFKKQLAQLTKETYGKKIILYGAGAFLQLAHKVYDFSKLNIIGISDKKFSNHSENETFLGYKVYSPDEIKNINPDIIIVTAKNYNHTIKLVYNDVIKNSNAEYMPLVKSKSASLIVQYFTIMFSGLFNRKYYLTQYGSKLNFLQKLFPMWHYTKNGWKHNFNPSNKFDAVYFQSTRPWILENPLYHYLKYIVKYSNFLNPTNYYLPKEENINKYLKAKAKRGKTKKVIYTCLTGDYDNLESIKSHHYIDNSWDYVCFTDNQEYIKKGQYGIWEIRPLEYTKSDNVRNNRWHKMHPHILFPNYDESIYLDTNINILSNRIFKQIKKWKKDLLLPKRLGHQCIYQEYKWIYKDKVDNRSIVRKEWKLIKQAGMPRNYGACECNLIYRKHKNPKIIKIMEEWWYFVENYSKRDQLAFPYVMWKNKLQIKDYSIENLKPYYKDYCLFKHNKQ